MKKIFRKSMLFWITLENWDASKSMSQHAFIAKENCGRWYEEKYEGNISLCGKIQAMNENEKIDRIDKLRPLDENIDTKNVCKKCLKIYKTNYEKARRKHTIGNL